MRHLADTWGLVMMAVTFVTFVGWTFRKGSTQRLHDAANMIFKDDEDDQAH
nr:cbb3-type cytochrome c oxidase subunit 3 [Polymorphobacter fuscus]